MGKKSRVADGSPGGLKKNKRKGKENRSHEKQPSDSPLRSLSPDMPSGTGRQISLCVHLSISQNKKVTLHFFSLLTGITVLFLSFSLV